MSSIAILQENDSERTTSAAGALGRAISRLEPGQISQSDLAYLKFLLAGLSGSIKEARQCMANRLVVSDMISRFS